MVILLIVVCSGLSYYLLTAEFSPDSVFADKGLVRGWVIGVLITVCLSVIFVLIFKSFKSAVNDKREKFLENPKEFVDTSNAMRIWTEEFVKHTKIPHTLIHTKGETYPRVVLGEGVVVDIRDTRHFKDPKMQTSESFLKFEVYANCGQRMGLNMVIIRLDEGEGYIRKNWYENFKPHENAEGFKLQRDEYPLTSAKAYSDRIQMKKLELLNDGDYTAEELKAYDQISKIDKSQDKVPLKAEKQDDNYYAESENKEVSEEDLNDLQKDINRYKKGAN